MCFDLYTTRDWLPRLVHLVIYALSFVIYLQIVVAIESILHDLSLNGYERNRLWGNV